MTTKLRRNYENYLDNYWETTFANTDIHGKIFRGTLKLVIDFIKENHDKLQSNEKKMWKNLYYQIQVSIRKQFPTKAQKNRDEIEDNDLIGPRKTINGFVKLGFIQPGLLSYHPDVDKFLEARTSKRRQSLFSKIVYDGSNFRSSATKIKPRGQLEFLIKTLEEVGKLCDDDIRGLMVTEISNYPAGFLTESELKSRVEFSKKPSTVDGSIFATDRILSEEEIELANQNGWKITKNTNGVSIIKSRKYNQFHFLKYLILAGLDDLSFKEGCLYFEEDAKKLFPEIPKGRDHYLHGIYKNLLKEETEEKLNEIQCMVEGISYPTLIASHIKRWEICDKEFDANTNDIQSHEGYDSDNGLYISKNLDDLFDNGWITFDDDGTIIFATNVHKSVKEKYKDAKINPVFLNPKRKEYLKWNRDYWFKK